MKAFSFIRKTSSDQLCSSSCLCRFTWFRLRGNQFSLELFYFLFISSFGFLILRLFDARTTSFTPRNLDLFFTSVSAATVSSMSTVEMEVFSNTQLIVLIILMAVGGEVFTSMVVLHLRKYSLNASLKGDNFDSSVSHIELDKITISEHGSSKFDVFCSDQTVSTNEVNMEDLRYKSYKFLCHLVMFYLLSVQFLGVVSVLIYISVISSAKNVLEQKGLQPLTFSVFTVISSFASCGFVPTNENMIPFRKNSGLLLIIVPQLVLGNTLYPPVLRLLIWAIGNFTKKAETKYLLKNYKALGYHHLLSKQHSLLLAVTVIGFIMIQFILFSSMEWSSGSLIGMNFYQKTVGILFQTVNSRHTGESIVDLSTVSAAVLVLFVVMMYLPPYTLFLPVAKESCEQENKKSRSSSSKVTETLVFSQLSYLVIFIISICIIERRQMVDDPLNFNVLNIVVEVISAYGNVGFSTGYSCDRRLKHVEHCENKWYGFSGKWSDQGKLVLIIVMIFGRLKKFNMNGGKAWKLL